VKDDGGDALIEIVRKCLPYHTYTCTYGCSCTPSPYPTLCKHAQLCAYTYTYPDIGQLLRRNGRVSAAAVSSRRLVHHYGFFPHTLAPFLRHGTFPSLPLQYHGIRVVNIVYLNVYICVCVCVCVCVCDRVCVRAFACPIAHTILCSSNRTPYMSTSISSRPYTYTYMHSIHTQKQTQTHIQKSRSRR